MDNDQKDLLMKYIYRGFETPSEGSSVHLVIQKRKPFWEYLIWFFKSFKHTSFYPLKLLFNSVALFRFSWSGTRRCLSRPAWGPLFESSPTGRRSNWRTTAASPVTWSSRHHCLIRKTWSHKCDIKFFILTAPFKYA